MTAEAPSAVDAPEEIGGEVQQPRRSPSRIRVQAIASAVAPRAGRPAALHRLVVTGEATKKVP